MTMTRKEQIKEAAYEAKAKHIGYGDSVVYAFIDGAEWADAHPNWISVEDELPPKNSEYDALSNNVLATDGKEIYESVYNHDFGEWFTHDLWAINNITHWMPRPVPPEHIAGVSKMIGSSELPNNSKGGEQ